MKKVSITGATGFVGSNLQPFLKDVNETIAVSRNELTHPSSEIFAATDVIVHLAGKAHDLEKTANPEEYYQVNFELTKGLYDTFLKSRASMFIFLSSVKAAADEVDGVLTEDVMPNPKTHYGKSKLKAEEYIQNQPLPEGKFYYILRPCMIHGPGNKGNLNILFKMINKKIPYPLGSFDNKRSLLSVDNLSFTIKSIIKSGSIPVGIYNVADDEPLTISEIIGVMANVKGLKAKVWKINKKLIKFVARIGDTIQLPLNSERLKKLTESYVVSNSKIKKELQINHFPIASKKGLIKTTQSF